MIIDYVVVTSHDVLLLVQEVQELLPEWQPSGGVAVKTTGGVEYYQAMVRIEDAKP